MSQPPSPTTEHLSFPGAQEDSPQPRSAISDSARQERLAALERRRLNSRRSTTDSLNTSQSGSLDAAQDPQPFDADHPKRIEFRRLADPGIMRPNSKEVALRSLRVNLKSPFASGLEVIMFSFFFMFTSRPPPSCRHYLKSQRICFTSLTTPSSVSSRPRIRSSSEISWILKARSSMRSRSVASLSLFSPYLCNVNILFDADGFSSRGLTHSPYPFSCVALWMARPYVSLRRSITFNPTTPSTKST